MRVTSKSGTTSIGSTRSVGSASGPAPAAGAPSVAAAADAMSVSGTAQFLAVARAHLAKIPDIRHAKVEAIRTKLASNSYKPDGEAVADGLVKEHLPTPRNP